MESSHAESSNQDGEQISAAWLLLDYGQVLSEAPPTSHWAQLIEQARECGWDGSDFEADYWAGRLAYDRGDVSAEQYWESVIKSPPEAEQREKLIRADQEMWVHPHHAVVDAAHRALQRGVRVAVLSNAPTEIAEVIDNRTWLSEFEPRIFSCQIGTTKPDSGAYQAAIRALGVPPRQIAFFDDRAENVAGASQMGLNAYLFQHSGQLDAVQPWGPPAGDPDQP